MHVVKLPDGLAICGDSTSAEVRDRVFQLVGGRVPLIIADPPYGNIVDEEWDDVGTDDVAFVQWMLAWTRLWAMIIEWGGAFYVWGGIGKPGFRPFLRYLVEVESEGILALANLITWSKKRAYGVSHNYLFTREECAYFCLGDIKKPRTFNIPLLETKRGYAGYDPEHPAKSEFYRRTNVWMDITEIFRGKLHPTQKQQRVMEVPIEVHTNPGEWVVDPFAGAGTTAFAARKLGRRFVVIEQNVECFEGLVARLQS